MGLNDTVKKASTAFLLAYQMGKGEMGHVNYAPVEAVYFIED